MADLKELNPSPGYVPKEQWIGYDDKGGPDQSITVYQNPDGMLDPNLKHPKEHTNHSLAIFADRFPSFDPRYFYVKHHDGLSEQGGKLWNGLAQFVKDFDRKFDTRVQEGHLDHSMFKEVTEARDSASKQHAHVQLLSDMALRLPGHEDVVIVCPMSGAANLATGLLREKPSFADRIFLTTISSSSGSESGHVRAKELPAECRDPKKILVVAEDIVDTTGTVLTILKDRLDLTQDEKKQEFDGYKNQLEETLAAKPRLPFDDERFQPVYHYIAKSLHESRTVFTAFISKNESFKKVLEAYIFDVLKKNPDDEWAAMQLLATGHMDDQEQFLWITGGNGGSENDGWPNLGLFDMGTTGESILPLINPEFRDRLKTDGFDTMTLRLLARVGPMLQFINNEENRTKWLEIVAQDINQRLSEGKLYKD